MKIKTLKELRMNLSTIEGKSLDLNKYCLQSFNKDGYLVDAHQLKQEVIKLIKYIAKEGKINLKELKFNKKSIVSATNYNLFELLFYRKKKEEYEERFINTIYYLYMFVDLKKEDIS